jgi:hypothetical protein
MTTRSKIVHPIPRYPVSADCRGRLCCTLWLVMYFWSCILAIGIRYIILTGGMQSYIAILNLYCGYTIVEFGKLSDHT